MDGVVNLDKPGGITSQDAVTRVKRIFKVKKAGHAGTLDPIATGVLLVCLGEATKISRFLMDLEKEYVATMKFGERTDTLDAEGEVVETVEGVEFKEEQLKGALERFKGTITQTPPMYSAVKVSGKPLYKLARKGLEAPRQERKVTVHELALEGFDFPFARIRVRCSKGTYIRSLIDDIGLAMETVAHMTGLRRTKIGRFLAEDSATMNELPEKKSAIVTADDALGHLQSVQLQEADFEKASHGRFIKARDYGHFGDGEFVRLRDSGGVFFAVGRAGGDRINIERIIRISGKPQAEI